MNGIVLLLERRDHLTWFLRWRWTWVLISTTGEVLCTSREHRTMEARDVESVAVAHQLGVHIDYSK